MRVKGVIAGAALIAGCAIAVVASAQTVTRSEAPVKATATIKQIDATKRLITFTNADGTEDVVWAGPEVKRFSELKPGDKVNMTYYASTVYKVRRPGDPPLSPKDNAAITASAGKLPGGTVASQTTSTVTVKSVDAAAGNITVTTADGRTVMRKVDKKEDLKGVKVGDKIDIIATEAVLATVDRSN